MPFALRVAPSPNLMKVDINEPAVTKNAEVTKVLPCYDLILSFKRSTRKAERST